jgi:hypothetical protein
MDETFSVDTLRRAIMRLPSDEPVESPRVWYRTRKEHWLGWLKGYHGPGAYGRKSGIKRDARFAYNHIVNPDMLLWLANAAGVSPNLVSATVRQSAEADSMPRQSATIRCHVPWEAVAKALWHMPEAERG